MEANHHGSSASDYGGIVSAVLEALKVLGEPTDATEAAAQASTEETGVRWDSNPDPEWVHGIEYLEWRLAEDGHLLTLVGKCPRCDHPMSERQVAPANANRPLPNIVITCNCLGKHDGRPDDVKRGCGRAGVFEHPMGPGRARPAQESGRFIDPDDFVSEYQRHTGEEPAISWDTRTDPEWVQYVESLRWKETAPEKIDDWWTRRLVNFDQRNKPPRTSLTIVGICPRCKHPMSDREERFSGSTEPPSIIIACNCVGTHKDRPADVTRGCGRAGFFQHPVREELVRAVETQPERTDPDDLIWENQRQLARMKALERTQATAEKWALTITAFTGLFGAAAVITGSETFTKVTGPHWIALVCWVLAFGLAVLSIYLGALAAQGVPFPPNMDGHRYRLVSLEDALKAGVQLKFSRRAAIVAMFALGLGVAATQLPTGGAVNSSFYLVQTEGGEVFCRYLQTTPEGRVLYPDGSPVVGTVTPVAQCPAAPAS